MLEPVTFLVCVSQDVFGFRRERQFNRGRNLLTQERSPLDLFANRLDGNLGAWKKASGQGFVFAHQTQQQVFGFDCRSSKLRRFVSREEDYTARFFGVAFEHFDYVKSLMITKPGKTTARQLAGIITYE